MSVVQSTTIQVPEWAVGFVYLMETSDRYQKIGFSRTPYVRVRSFRHLPFVVWVSHVIPVGTQKVETAMHHLFADKRLRQEWFLLTASEIATIKQVRGCRNVAELREILTRTPSLPEVTLTHFGSRKAVWYRSSRDQWYAYLAGRQTPLGVFGRDNKVAAEQALDALKRAACAG